MVAKNITVQEIQNWLDDQELICASAQGTGGVRIRLLYRPASGGWVTYLGGVLYQGLDLSQAVETFNEHTYE
jgi:hypothetical protein